MDHRFGHQQGSKNEEFQEEKNQGIQEYKEDLNKDFIQNELYFMSVKQIPDPNKKQFIFQYQRKVFQHNEQNEEVIQRQTQFNERFFQFVRAIQKLIDSKILIGNGILHNIIYVKENEKHIPNSVFCRIPIEEKLEAKQLYVNILFDADNKQDMIKNLFFDLLYQTKQLNQIGLVIRSFDLSLLLRYDNKFFLPIMPSLSLESETKFNRMDQCVLATQLCPSQISFGKSDLCTDIFCLIQSILMKLSEGIKPMETIISKHQNPFTLQISNKSFLNSSEPIIISYNRLENKEEIETLINEVIYDHKKAQEILSRQKNKHEEYLRNYQIELQVFIKQELEKLKTINDGLEFNWDLFQNEIKQKTKQIECLQKFQKDQNSSIYYDEINKAIIEYKKQQFNID